MSRIEHNIGTKQKSSFCATSICNVDISNIYIFLNIFTNITFHLNGVLFANDIRVYNIALNWFASLTILILKMGHDTCVHTLCPVTLLFEY